MITSCLWLAKLRNVQPNCEVNSWCQTALSPKRTACFYNNWAVLKSIYYYLRSFFSAVPSTSRTPVATWKAGCMILGRTGVYFKCMMWNYYVHCGRMRQDRASISAPRHEGFSVLCNTKSSRWLISHAPSSKLTGSLPLDSWFCSKNVVSVRFTSLAVFVTFQPVYYSADPYPHNGGTLSIARWQARVPCSLAVMFVGITTPGPFVRYLWEGGVIFCSWLSK